jgi:hypothetical protein
MGKTLQNCTPHLGDAAGKTPGRQIGSVQLSVQYVCHEHAVSWATIGCE